MAQYNITLSDGVTVIPIPDGSVDLTAADIPLVGQNSQLYGDDIARAQLFMLENFAHTSAPAINTLTGQLWYDTTNNAINVYNGTGWDPMAPFVVGTANNSMTRWDTTAASWLEETQVTLTAGGVLSILDSGLTDSVAFDHDGADFNIVGTNTTDINITGVTAVNMPSLTLVTALAEIEGGTGTDTYVTGDILFASGANTLAKLAVGSNTEVLTLAGGVPTWAAGGGGGGGDHGGLTGLGDDDHSQYAQIAATETISSVWTYSARPAFNSTGAPMTINSNTLVVNFNADLLDGVEGSAYALDAEVVHDTGAESVAGVKTLTDILKVNTGVAGSGQGVRVLGFASTDSTNSGYFSVYHQDEGQEQVRLGTGAGNSFSEVRALTADLNLYAANTLVFNLNATETTITNGGAPAMTWHAATGNNTTTTAGVYDTGGTERNVGYNETPETLVVVSRSITANDIGEFLRRSASTSRALTLDNVGAIPIGGSLLVHNDHTTGTLTIIEGTATLEWVDGGGTAPSTGTRTIAYNGIATLRKKSSTVWQIWGNGIS